MVPDALHFPPAPLTSSAVHRKGVELPSSSQWAAVRQDVESDGLIQLKSQRIARAKIGVMARRSVLRTFVAVLAVAEVAGCGTVPVEPPSPDAPLFRRIDARVGASYASAARMTYVTNPLMRIEVGKASVARFEKAFAAMFTETVELPDWPPWRHEAPPVDGVIELERVDAELLLGNDSNRPDFVSVGFRVCLYEPNAAEIRCWTPSARNSHQRGLAECLDLRECVVPQMEIAMREAIAVFLVAAESDPAVREWAARLRKQSDTP